MSVLVLAACAEDPVGGDEAGCPDINQLNFAANRIAVSYVNGPVRLSTLAGDPERVLIAGNVNAQHWSPAGIRLVYVDDRGAGEYALSVTDTMGNATQLPVPLRSTWPVWSKDDWIYFFTQNNSPPQIYRIRPNGTSLSNAFVVGAFPAPSPDGTRFAYRDGAGIAIYNLSSSTSTPLTTAGTAIALRWSPDGKLIAYIDGGQVYLVQPDGAGKRIVGPTGVGGISWSANSCFILAGTYTGSMALISVAQGAFVHLSETGVYPDWKP